VKEILETVSEPVENQFEQDVNKNKHSSNSELTTTNESTKKKEE